MNYFMNSSVYPVAAAWFAGLFLFAGFLLPACHPVQQNVPGAEPTGEEARDVIWSLVRYLGKLPGKATHYTKYDTYWDDHYQRVAELHRLDWLYRDETTGDLWLLVSRVAPSIHAKRVAIGIHLRMEQDSVTYYHEVFRTWKMPEEELKEKSMMLFGKMVRDEDLSMYYPEQAGDAYIEFPNAEVYFDIENRYWVSTRENPLAAWRDIYGKSETEEEAVSEDQQQVPVKN